VVGTVDDVVLTAGAVGAASLDDGAGDTVVLGTVGAIEMGAT
jgi:hypothetical protein